MNYDTLIDALTCPLSNIGAPNRHFFENPRYLPCCHRTACNKCIIKYLSARKSSSSMNDYILSCPICKITSRVSLSGEECLLDADNLARIELEKNLIEINHYLIKKLELSVKNIEDRFACKENYLSKRKAIIEHEIHSQVEQLKNHLDQLEQEMKESLEISSRNMRSNLEKFETLHRDELDDLKVTIENLKLNSLSYINGDSKNNKLSPRLSQVMQFQSIDNCILHLNDLSKLSHTFSDMVGELTFDPNQDLPEKSLIGHLKQINDTNLKEQFKNIKSQTYLNKIRSIPGSNQQMPLSPRYIAVADAFNLFLTDSQTKQLIQIKLDTGDYVRSTNLNGQLKNPDGVCVNPKAGHIYVGDSEQKCIYKLDFEFNVLKKFGNKDLKWPKGMCYDYEANSILGEMKNPDRLYVCDYSSQRIAIYNQHEQLRDFLTISLTDEPIPTFNKTNLSENSKYLMHDQKQLILSDEEYKFCPLNVQVSKNLIYVTDDWTGGNCIRVFDKQTHCLLRNVGDLNAWNPLGLVIDDLGNVFTTARLYYETGVTHLFCFDKDGEFVYKTSLNVNSECITDIAVDKFTDRSNHRLMCSGDKKLHSIQF